MMQRTIAAILLYLGLATAALAQATGGPPNQILCNKVAQMAAGPAAITQVVPLAAGKTIFVCGWHVTNTAASGNFSFSYGTGSNCGTGTTTIIPAMNVTSSAPSADHIDYAQISAPPGNALCITPSVATIAAIIYYSQF